MKQKTKAIFIVAVLALTTIAVASPADAATRSRSYYNVDELHLADIGICARVITSGTLTARYTNPSRRTEKYDNMELKNPKITVYTYSRVNGRCQRNNVQVGKAVLTQRWSGYSCSFDPAIGVSWPWGVSVEGWAGCGNEQMAKRSTTYYTDHWYYQQSNSGAPVDFGKVSQHKRYSGPCFGYDVEVTLWNTRGNASDSNHTIKHKVCLR